MVNICQRSVHGPKHAALLPVADNARGYPLQVCMALAAWTIAKIIPFQFSQMPFPRPIMRLLWRAACAEINAYRILQWLPQQSNRRYNMHLSAYLVLPLQARTRGLEELSLWGVSQALSLGPTLERSLR